MDAPLPPGQLVPVLDASSGRGEDCLIQGRLKVCLFSVAIPADASQEMVTPLTTIEQSRL